MAISDEAWARVELERRVGELEQALTRLTEKASSLAAENEVLTATVRAALAMLGEAGSLDLQLLSRRVDEVLADARSAGPTRQMPASASGAPYRDGLPPLARASESDASKVVACAGCGRSVALEEADVVDYGTGYRCLSCTTSSQIGVHIERAVEAAEERGRTRGLIEGLIVGSSDE